MGKCASVAIVGRPSSGKSTLVNTICESKVSITSPSPQTTRNAIRGIYTDTRGQIIFTDTPGYHNSEKAFNRHMLDIVEKQLEECDSVIYLIDATRAPGAEEDTISFMLSALNVPVICCINKNDIATPAQLEKTKSYLASHMPARKVFELSALKDNGIDEILIELFANAPEGELLYDENARTDQDLEFRISEIIREKAMNTVSAEIPQAIFVEVSDMEYDKENAKIWVRAFITVERESQKGIMVGKGGANIKKIRVVSFKEIKKIFPTLQLQLDLRVKVNSKWKSNEMTLKTVFRETQA